MEKRKPSGRGEPIPSILKKPKDRKGDLLDKSTKIKREKADGSKKGNVNVPLPQGCTPLMYACQQADYKGVIDSLNKDPASVRVRDRGLRCALHYCASSGGAGGQAARAACADRVLMAAPSLADARDADGLTPLHLAVVHGNVPLVQTLLAAGADVNAQDDEHHTVVHWATGWSRPNRPTGQLLSERQGQALELTKCVYQEPQHFQEIGTAKVITDDFRCERHAVVCGEVGALRAVLAAGADAATPDQHGGYPLHYAAQMCGAPAATDHQSRGAALEVLRALVKEGGARVEVRDADGRTPLLWAASAGSAAAVLALHQAGARVDDADRDGLTALHCAAARGHTEALETLVGLCGARVDVADSHGCTPLHYAAALGHADATSALLAHGADAHRQDRRGRSPAHTAAAKGQIETVRILGARGTNLWLRNSKGDLPLHEAVASGRRDLVKWLLDGRPSQVNSTNHEGRTPLHIAAATDNADLCRLLLDRGAEVNPVARSSKNDPLTPLDCATTRGHRSTAKYLQMHGGLPASKLSNTQIMIDGAPITALPTRKVTSTKIDVRDRIRIEKREVVELSSPVQARRHLKDSDSDTNSEYSSENKKYVRKSEDRRNSRYTDKRKKVIEKQKSFSDGYDSEFETYSKKDRRRKDRKETRQKKSRSKSEPSRRSKHSAKNHRRYRSSSESSSDSHSYVEKKKYKRHRKRGKRKSSTSSESSSSESSDRRYTKRRGKKTSIHIENDDEKQSVNIVKYKSTDVEQNADTKDNVAVNASSVTPTVSVDPDHVKDTQSIKSKTHSETETDTLSVKTNMVVTEAQIHMERESSQHGSSELTVTVDSSNNVSIETNNMTVTQKDSVQETKSDTEKPLIGETNVKDEQGDSKAEIDSETKLSDDNTPEDIKDMDMSNKNDTTGNDQDQKRESVSDETKKSLETDIEQSKDKESDGNVNGSNEMDTRELTSTSEVEPARKRSFQILSGPEDFTSSGKEPVIEKKVSSEEHGTLKSISPGVSFANEDEIIDIKDPELVSDHLMGEHVKHSETIESKDSLQEDTDKETKQMDGKRKDTVSAASSSENMESSDRGIVTVFDEESPIKDRAVQQIVMQNESEEFDENLSPSQLSPRRLSKISKEREDFQAGSRKSSIYETESYKVLSDIAPMNDVSPGILKKSSRTDEGSIEEDKDTFAGGILFKDNSLGRVPSVSDNEIYYSHSEANGRRKRFRKKGRTKSRITIRSKSENSERGYESSGLMDSGFEPSPRPHQRLITSPRLNAYYQQRNITGRFSGKSDSKIPVRKPGDKNAVDMRSVTQRIQTNMRRYYCERKIFQHLLELKRLQIRTSKANEAVLVKRAIDEYNKSSLSNVGLGPYNKPDLSFSSFEKFLYESLRKLQKSGKRHLDNLPEKPIDFDYGESELYKMCGIPDNPCLCTSKTHRCYHAVHAYTGIPCSAYIPYRLNHHTMPKPATAGGTVKSKGFLPKINSKPPSGSGKAHVTLEVSHGSEKQLIALPAERLDKNKRYYVTFTVKGSEPPSDNDNASPKSPLTKSI